MSRVRCALPHVELLFPYLHYARFQETSLLPPCRLCGRVRVGMMPAVLPFCYVWTCVAMQPKSYWQSIPKYPVRLTAGGLYCTSAEYRLGE